MSPKKHFLILTSDSGFGHRTAANAIAEAFRIQHPQDAVTHVVNPIFRESVAHFLQKIELNYDQTMKEYPDEYRFFYEFSDNRSVSSLVESILTWALQKSIQNLIDEIQPHAIINANPMFNAPVGSVLDKTNQQIPFYTVITDLADVHKMWFNDKPERFYVATNTVRDKAIETGLHPKKILVSGIPVDPTFESIKTPRPEMKMKLGLNPELVTLLFVGSRRVRRIFENLKALEKISSSLQAVVIAGGDDDLYEKIQARTWGFPIHVKNYVENIPEWMLGSDVLITKAGGMILSEGLAAGLPMIIIDHLPGQEEGNRKYIIDQGAGVAVENPKSFYKLINEWLENDKMLLKLFANKSHLLGRPEAAFTIADDLWNAVTKFK
jgi:1,2-diacylglycerol 3-beta-galactosyltransferase